MLGQTRECRGCGIEFVQERAGQRYHDPACQIRSNNAKQLVQRLELNREYKRRRYDEARPWREFVCEGCGETVKTQKLRKRRFCSKHCKNVIRSQEWYRSHTEQIREYREATRERRTIQHAAWRSNNLEQQQEYVRTYSLATRSTVPWRFLLTGAKTRAKQKNLPFDLTEEWAVARWTGKCELTGLSFVLGGKWETLRTFWPTIDKITPARGYTQDNCRFVLWAVNTFKGQDTDAVIYSIAEALLSHRRD